MSINDPEYITKEKKDGNTYWVDRRVPELQPTGETVIRDPVTGNAWRADGTPLPRGWHWQDDFDAA